MKEGKLRGNNYKFGVIYNGKFYEFGTLEFRNLMLIEGKERDKQGTLLDYFSQAARTNLDSLIDKN